jgi:hypothetical protein
MIPSLIKHYSENSVSFIEKILGVYSIQLQGLKPCNIMIQKNAIKLSPSGKLIACFDLKGSSFQRSVIPDPKVLS